VRVERDQELIDAQASFALEQDSPTNRNGD